MVFSAGQSLVSSALETRIAALEAARAARATATATTTYTSTTTQTAVPGLTLPLLANTKYAWEAMIGVFGLNGVGVTLGLLLPTGATFDAWVQGYNDANGVLLNLNHQGASGTVQLGAGNGFGFGNTSNGASNTTSVISRGTITTAATAASVTVLAAQRVSSASNSAVQVSAWIEIRKVPA